MSVQCRTEQSGTLHTGNCKVNHWRTFATFFWQFLMSKYLKHLAKMPNWGLEIVCIRFAPYNILGENCSNILLQLAKNCRSGQVFAQRKVRAATVARVRITAAAARWRRDSATSQFMQLSPHRAKDKLQILSLLSSPLHLTLHVQLQIWRYVFFLS